MIIKIRRRTGLILFLVGLNFLTIPCFAKFKNKPRGPAAATSAWSMTTDDSVLKKTFQPISGDSTVKALYTCEGVAGASDVESKTSVQPRVILRGPEHATVWVCATPNGMQIQKPNVIHVRDNVAVFLKMGDRAPKRLISQTGDLARPVDVEIVGDKLHVIDNFVIRNGSKITSWRPMTRVEVSCEGGACTPSAPKCILALQKKDDRRIVSRFDQAVQKYKASKHKDPQQMVKSEPFQLLDQLLLIAASGDKKASDRLQNFPIQPEGDAMELLGKYVDQLDQFKSMGCFSASAGGTTGSL